MFKKTISGLSLVAAAFGLAAFSAPAAACTDTPDWDCIHDGTGTYPTAITNATYHGTATMSHWYTGQFWCNKVKATGDVTISGGTATIDITDFADNGSTSDAKCGNTDFTNFPWSGSHNGTGSPSSNTATTATKFDLSTPTIIYSGTQVCQGTVTVTFQNDGSGGSIFDFDDTIPGWGGDCDIDGTFGNSTISAH